MKTAYSAIITISTVTMLFSASVGAEMRTWTDSRGNKIQAELLENMHGNVTLMRDNGKEAHISISDLSATDQKYILKNSPPKIDIQVSEVTSRKNKGFSFENEEDSSYDRDVQVQTSSSHYKVALKKSGTIPYDKPIQAELYVFGYKKQDDAFVLMSKTVNKFTFDQGDIKDKYVFESNPVTTVFLYELSIVASALKMRCFHSQQSPLRIREVFCIHPVLYA